MWKICKEWLEYVWLPLFEQQLDLIQATGCKIGTQAEGIFPIKNLL